MAYLQCLYSPTRQNHLKRTHVRFFRNAPKKSAGHSPVSSRTRPKNQRDTRAFLQERAQKIRETLARFFRNAPKKSARHSRVSSGTRPKFGETLARFFRNAPKIRRDTCAFLQERIQNSARHLGETLARFFRNAPNSARHLRVSSRTHPKIKRNTRAFLERTRSKIP